MLNQVILAREIATRAHAGQFRRDGFTPYIEHPKAVAYKVMHYGDDYSATAFLHDVLEDTTTTSQNLREAGVSETIIAAVLVLTKDKTLTYHQYLNEVHNNPIARKVKIADMLHNLSDAPTDKQIIKYAHGLITLVY
jgi:(p)ppGpp synthase/HD superfamily hydrolase